MKRKVLMFVCCMALVLSTACGSNPKLKDGKEIVASLNGKDFTAEDLYEELKTNYGYDTLLTLIDNYIAEQEIETTDELKETAQDYVDYYASYAESLGVEFKDFMANYMGMPGITSEDEFFDYMVSLQKVSKAIEKQVTDSLTDEEIEDYYNEYYSEKLTVRHILFEFEESDKNGEEALASAKELIEELKKTDEKQLEDKFSELAKEYSDDGSYSNGGLISDFMKKDMVSAFWDASYKLKDGEYTTTPVKTEYGYHIIYRVSSAKKPSLADSKEDIKSTLASKKLDEDSLLQYEVMNTLRDKYKLSILDKDLKSYYDEYLQNLKNEKENNKKS